MAVELPVMEGAKRSAEEAAAGEPPAKAAKVEGDVKEEVKAEVKDEIKAEIKDEMKTEVKAEGTPSKEKKEKKEHKEGKEKKEKKDKSEKHKDKDKKEKKEKTADKENDVLALAKRDKFPSASPEVDKELDQRKLFKEGQRFITPPVADATRAFYESLIAENPDSKIAIRFVVEYGLFSAENHKPVLKRFNKLKEKGAFDAKILMTLQLAKKDKKDKEKGDKKDKSDKKEKKEKSEKTMVATEN